MAAVERRSRRTAPDLLADLRKHGFWTLRHEAERMISATITKLLTQVTDDAGLPPLYWHINGDFKHGTTWNFSLHGHAGADYDAETAIAVVRRYAEKYGDGTVQAKDMSSIIIVEAIISIEETPADVWCTWWTNEYATPRPQVEDLHTIGTSRTTAGGGSVSMRQTS